MQQRQVVSGEGMAAGVVGGRSGGAGGGGAGGTGGGSVTAVCRPSGLRWTPTPEQIRILKELYYGCGVRSPNSEQIQRITAMLRQHGKIEGKNVFYWFQNHKARERQKRRLTSLDVNAPAAAAADASHIGVLSLSPSGAPSPSSALTAGNGGASAMQPVLDTSSDWDSGAAMAATGTCFLQDYMGVRSTGGNGHGHHGITAGAASPWACFSSPGQRAAATRAPETLPLFPTGDNNGHPRPRHGGPGDAARGGHSSSYLPSLPRWGAAATTTSVAIQQQQQLQGQYSFCSNTQLPSQDASAGAASLELSLSSWCSPYPAGMDHVRPSHHC